MKNYFLQGDGKEVAVTDRLNRKIMLQKVSSGKEEDYYLKIANEAKQKKESSMSALAVSNKNIRPSPVILRYNVK
jgi:hypothetical protein